MNERIEGPDDGGLQAWTKNMYLELRTIKEMEVLIREITHRLRENTIESVVGKFTPWDTEERMAIIKVGSSERVYTFIMYLYVQITTRATPSCMDVYRMTSHHTRQETVL